MPDARTQQHDRQQRIDFTGRTNSLSSLRLDNPPAEWRTSATTMTAVLKELAGMIGSKDGFRARHEAIAARMNCGQSAVKRAIRGLKKLGLVEDTRTGRASVYSINWAAVQKLSTKGKQPAAVPHQIGQRAPSDRSLCSIRRGTVPHQIGHCAPSQHENTAPNVGECNELERDGGEPTYPLTETSTPAPTWAAVANVFRGAGVKLADDLAREAAQLEYSPDECAEIVATYKANRKRFTSSGAIAFRIRRGQWPADGVKEARVVQEAEARRAAELAQNRADVEQRLADQEQSRAELAALEKTYGRELDELDDDDRLRLARSVFRDQFTFDMYRRNPNDSYVRHELLTAIHDNRTRADDDA